MEPISNKCSTIKVFIAVSLFAMSSWINVRGLFVELPLFIQVLPEGWRLPSYLTIITQAANISPFTYMIINKFRPNFIEEWITACVIMWIGIASSFILVIVWDETSYILGELHSTALFIMSFFISLVDCTSSIIYLPYMARFKSPLYLTAYYIGDGLSGLIPAFIGLLQGSHIAMDTNYDHNRTILNISGLTNSTLGNELNVRFSIGVFFIILTAFLIISLVSFLFINFHCFFDSFKSAEDNSKAGQNWTASSLELDIITNASSKHSNQQLNKNETETNFGSNDTRGNFTQGLTEETVSSSVGLNSEALHKEDESKNLSQKGRCIILYLVVAWISCLLYGIIPAIQSYTCLPYGYMTYDLAVKLSLAVNPLACFLTLFITVRRTSIITMLTIFGSLMTAYQIYLAALSPNPILKDQVIGKVLVILSSVILNAFFIYAKICISTILTEVGGKHLLMYYGAITQAGSIVGAIIGLLLVDVFNVFHDK